MLQKTCWPQGTALLESQKTQDEPLPQGLKPFVFWAFVTRLKSCPPGFLRGTYGREPAAELEDSPCATGGHKRQRAAKIERYVEPDSGI